ncbi:MAG: hypothetical protein R3D44_17155 [Hyphomicrobiaceae bacterium]
MDFEAGQQWAYAGPEEIADSRIIIGAIVDYGGGRAIACCAVTDALQSGSDGKPSRVVIPFLPMTVEALAQSVTRCDGTGKLPDSFAAELDAWQNDPRGASYFTVPFQGSLERMVAMQMAALVEKT